MTMIIVLQRVLLTQKNDTISAASDPNIPVARYPSDIEIEEISIKSSAKDNYLDYLVTQFYDDDKKDECISSDNSDSQKLPRVDSISSTESNDGYMEVNLSEIRKELTETNVEIEKKNSLALSAENKEIQEQLK